MQMLICPTRVRAARLPAGVFTVWVGGGASGGSPLLHLPHDSDGWSPSCIRAGMRGFRFFGVVAEVNHSPTGLQGAGTKMRRWALGVKFWALGGERKINHLAAKDHKDGGGDPMFTGLRGGRSGTRRGSC